MKLAISDAERTLNTDRFWAQVGQTWPDACWEWQGSITSSGYGQMWTGTTMDSTHRIAYEQARGPIPEGLFVCHSCDNRKCCNPFHLWLGTPEENVADMWEKGRGRTKTAQGEAHFLAKLTEEKVLEIRARYAGGGVSHQTLADEFGVSKRLISNVIRRTAWSHVAEAA